MDESLTKEIQLLTSQEGVSGILLADKNGLCLGAYGDASPAASGFVTMVANQAKKNGKDSVCVAEGEKEIIVTKQNNITVAIFKDLKNKE